MRGGGAGWGWGGGGRALPAALAPDLSAATAGAAASATFPPCRGGRERERGCGVGVLGGVGGGETRLAGGHVMGCDQLPTLQSRVRSSLISGRG